MLARLVFAHLPTPIEELNTLTEELNGPRLLIKRDDRTGLSFGGNKIRKLEYLFAEAQAEGARLLITTGGAQSNHCRQTAAAAARFGFDCVLVLTGPPPAQVSGNLFLDQLFGAEIVWAEPEKREQTLQDVFDQTQKDGRKPFLIPLGGSTPVGSSAYAYAIQEVSGQLDELPDWIVFATGSGGTQAGMLVGKHVFGSPSRILGICVYQPAKRMLPIVTELAGEAAEVLGKGFDPDPAEVLVNDDYLGKGYGDLTDQTREAIWLFAQREGILLDPVYTGKAAAGLIDLIQQGFFKRDETVLFWHTGGTPGLFAEAYLPALLAGKSNNQ